VVECAGGGRRQQYTFCQGCPQYYPPSTNVYVYACSEDEALGQATAMQWGSCTLSSGAC
jgi:hypothetical protein